MSDALQQLIDAVETGTLHEARYGGMPMATACYREVDGEDWGQSDARKWSDRDCLAAYHGSLDAAMALHKALLPGWFVCDISELPRRAEWVAAVHPRDGGVGDRGIAVKGKTAARALLEAILKAYQQEKADE